MKTQKVIIADGNRYFREGLKSVLLNIGHVSVVGEVENGTALLEILQEKVADIVFLDIALPGINGCDVVSSCHGNFPETAFIAFTGFENQRYIRLMVDAGAGGFLFKSSDNYDVLQTIISDPHRTFFVSPGIEKQQFMLQQLNKQSMHS